MEPINAGANLVVFGTTRENFCCCLLRRLEDLRQWWPVDNVSRLPYTACNRSLSGDTRRSNMLEGGAQQPISNGPDVFQEQALLLEQFRYRGTLSNQMRQERIGLYTVY